jgi:hypothetical protein
MSATGKIELLGEVGDSSSLWCVRAPHYLLLLQVKDATMKKMKSLEEAKEAVESERDGLKATVASLKRDVDAARQAASSEQKKLDELAHERDILNKLRTQVWHQWRVGGAVQRIVFNGSWVEDRALCGSHRRMTHQQVVMPASKT